MFFRWKASLWWLHKTPHSHTQALCSGWLLGELRRWWTTTDFNSAWEGPGSNRSDKGGSSLEVGETLVIQRTRDLLALGRCWAARGDASRFSVARFLPPHRGRSRILVTLSIGTKLEQGHFALAKGTFQCLGRPEKTTTQVCPRS